MKKILKVVGVILTFFLLMTATPSWAAHPLITDDTGTQGKGKFQIELNGEYEHDDEDGVKSKLTTVAGTFSAGVTDTVDLVLGVPFQFLRVIEDTDEGHEITTEEGIADISLEVKWRFFERNGLSFAFKPGVTFPSGDRKEGLGGGRMTASFYLISTLGKGPVCFHVNAGYIQNENKNDERKELWHASLAVEYSVLEKLRLVANFGVDRNADRASQTNPCWGIGGIIYSLTDSLDLDAGVKAALNGVAPDYSLLAGLTWSF
ncbi:MAG TPA: transporter [Syntrophales bacterium]|nr:transporter [Syntrophales bacterium]